MSLGFACVYCGAPASEWDHLTGRDDAGVLFDPELVVPACRRCNLAGLEMWRTFAVDRVGDADPECVRLIRLAVAFARVGSTGEMVELPAATCQVLFGTLAAAARTISRERSP